MGFWSSFVVAGDWPVHAGATEEGICRLDIAAEERAFLAALAGAFPDRQWRRDDGHALLVEAHRQLEEYFAGTRREFDLPLDLQGTPHQRKVWEQLRKIPFGQTRSYADLALRTASVARAVGQANGRNPVAIVVPCHRVINSGGKLGGYAAGLDRKRRLLELESGAGILKAQAR